MSWRVTFFAASIYWADEAMVFLVIWSIFLAAIAVTYDGSHLTMDLFSARLSPRWQRALDGVIAAVCVLTFTFMAWQAMTVVRTLMRNDQRSIALDIPIAIAHSALLVGFIFSALVVLARVALGHRVVKPMSRTTSSPESRAVWDGRQMTWVMTVLPLVLLVLGFPIFVILLASSAIAIVCFYSIPPTALQQVMFGTLDSSALLAVPFFIFAGEIMGFGGVSRRLVDWTKSLLGGTKASLPITTVGTCVVFGAISGSSAATVAAVGRITFKPMVDAGYDVRFATGLLTASGLIDNMIPPAIAMILYAAVAEQSLVRIFTAGFVPAACLPWLSWRTFW